MLQHLTKKMLHNREWLVVLALSLTITLLRLPSLEQPFDNDSGANAYHARLIVRGEPLYGTHHPAHHMPAVYYVYALAFLVFGDSVWAVKLFLIPWTIVTAYLLYQLGVLLTDRTTGLLAAIFYAILSSHVFLFGSTAEIELFANLPRLAAVLVLLHLITKPAATWKFVFVGLLSAAAFLFKAIYLSPLAMAGLVLLADLWRTRTMPGAWRTTVMRGFWVGLGFIAGLFPVVAYFGLLGLLPRFLLVFTLGQGYVGFRQSASMAQQYWPLYPLLGLAINNAALLIFSLAGMVAAITGQLWRSRARRSEAAATIFLIAVWYILSFVEAGITRVLFLHYYLLTLPPLTLLAAWFLLKLYRDVRHRQPANRLAAAGLLALSLTITLYLSVRQNFDYYFLYARYKLGKGTFQDFVVDGWSTQIGAEFVRVQELADFVQAHTHPSDYVYYWSGGVQLYYQADRRCPTDTIWPLYVEATGPYQRIFGPQTKYVILGESNSIPRPDWLYAELVEKYTLETVIHGQEIYRRID